MVSLFNGILTFWGYLMFKPNLQKDISDIIQPIAEMDKRVPTFPKGISLKVNAMVGLVFELI